MPIGFDRLGTSLGRILDRLRLPRSTKLAGAPRQADSTAQTSQLGQLVAQLNSLARAALDLSTPEKVAPRIVTSSDQSQVYPIFSLGTETANRGVSSAPLAQSYISPQFVPPAAQPNTQLNQSKSYSADSAGAAGAGTLFIRVGSEAATAVSFTGDDSLSTIAARINGAAAGVGAQVVHDGSTYRIVTSASRSGIESGVTFSSDAQGLQPDTLGLSARQSRGAIYNLEVDQVAAGQVNRSQVYGSDTAGVAGSGTLYVKVGSAAAVSVDYDASDTLSDIADKITALDAGVSASIVTDDGSYRLLVTGETGEDNTITYSSNAAGTVADGLGLSANRTQTAQDASFTVNGRAFQRSTNIVTDAISGVAFELVGATPSDSAATTLVVGLDEAALRDKVETLVESYNALAKMVGRESREDRRGGDLLDNPTLGALRRQLETIVRSLFPSRGGPTQINQSNGFASDTAGVTGSGSFYITSGSVRRIVTYGAGDSLTDIANKITGLGIGLGATVSFDRTSYRVVVTATDSAKSYQFSLTPPGSHFVEDPQGNSDDALGFATHRNGARNTSVADIGISINPDETLALDGSTFSRVVTRDLRPVQNLFLGDGRENGLSQALLNLAGAFAPPILTGLKTVQQNRAGPTSSYAEQVLTRSAPRLLDTELQTMARVTEQFRSQIEALGSPPPVNPTELPGFS